MTPETVARLRRDTPACETLLHFNNAGAALIADPVHQTVLDYLDAERRMGGYEAEAALAPRLDRFYTGFAELLGGEPSEIAYAESATRAWDSVFYGLDWREGDEVIIHVSDYGSNTLSLLQMQARKGIVIRECPSDETGQIDVLALDRMIGPRTRLVALSHIPTQGGMVNPAAAVGCVTRDHGVFYLLDACQSLGQVEVDVQAIGCDALSGTGRKFLRGPRGTGVLWVSKAAIGRLDPPFIDGHSARVVGDGFDWEPGAKRFEAFEQNYAGKAGLARAVDYALEVGMPVIAARIAGLAATLRAELSARPGVTVRDQGERKGGIVTFTVEDRPSRGIVEALRAKGINTSLSYARWAPKDFARRHLPEMVRASVHAYNTEDEIERFIAALDTL
ncbi:aminotransferase class V-fold PLP-dependent enzyme [Tabrizicola sp. J26]|uniref:aminotransferase class V-fold PLP-dependent enzyme n=1 Tax=Alitabrizicola rongguiensis TaxID=2909234 RepID=UPI001F312DE3|nr:aminotransferase class V-fold PLP-dependent enzyme [Tabrizicola rongguiensis]MCF1707827.1 aminotransferase class V-fold PLP-dependent enzyme [Tabrizicola rongguiensis]